MYPNVVAEYKRAGLTLQMIADKLDITISTLSQKLNGKYPITFDEAVKIRDIIVDAKQTRGITINIDMAIDVLFEEVAE